jgi:hypothetical protein
MTNRRLVITIISSIARRRLSKAAERYACEMMLCAKMRGKLRFETCMDHRTELSATDLAASRAYYQDEHNYQALHFTSDWVIFM